VGSFLFQGDDYTRYLAITDILEDTNLAIETDREETYQKECALFTLQWVLHLHLQASMRRAQRRVMRHGDWNSWSLKQRACMVNEVVERTREYITTRFELHWLTQPTPLSVFRKINELGRYVQDDEVLLERIGDDDPSQSSGKRLRSLSIESGKVDLGSASTLPNRPWRIIRAKEEVPIGFQRVTLSGGLVKKVTPLDGRQLK
jgi:hypothetical protein